MPLVRRDSQGEERHAQLVDPLLGDAGNQCRLPVAAGGGERVGEPGEAEHGVRFGTGLDEPVNGAQEQLLSRW